MAVDGLIGKLDLFGIEFRGLGNVLESLVNLLINGIFNFIFDRINLCEIFWIRVIEYFFIELF